MGLGKTISTLTALKDLFDQKTIKKALIIAPLRVSNHTWPTEIHNWEHTRALKFTVLAGLPPKKREQALSEMSNIFIINRENVPWLVDFYSQKWPFDMVVIDESSSFKSHKSKRYKALRKIVGRTTRMIQLTGTPAPNSLIDLWPQIYLLDKGQRLGKTRRQFLEKYCVLSGNPLWNNYVLKKDSPPLISAKIKDLVLRLKANDYLDLPPKIIINVRVALPLHAIKAYKKMENDFLLSYDSGDIIAANAAVKINKLLQISNGNIYNEDKSYKQIHSAKLDALEDILNAATSPVLIAYNFKSDLQEILKRFPFCQVLSKNPEQINHWNKKLIDVLIAHPSSAGHGLNLQGGGHTIVWYGLLWSNEVYLQFNARLDRQGQKYPVRIYHLLANDTVDHLVFEILQKKHSDQEKLFSLVREMRQLHG